jgi:hypothetical protein
MYEVFSGMTTSQVVVGPTFNPKAAEVYAYKVRPTFYRPWGALHLLLAISSYFRRLSLNKCARCCICGVLPLCLCRSTFPTFLVGNYFLI